jgi:hypothetical protein
MIFKKLFFANKTSFYLLVSLLFKRSRWSVNQTCACQGGLLSLVSSLYSFVCVVFIALLVTRLHTTPSPQSPQSRLLAKFCSVLFTNIINKHYFYKFYVFFNHTLLYTPPRTVAAAAAREADAVAQARRRPAGSPRSRCKRPQTDAAL